MNKTYRNYIIIKLINKLKGTHNTYWHLNRLADWQLLELYNILIDNNNNNDNRKDELHERISS